ncbi:hypothetical protein V6N11_019163 [Hibiscus sabdariffa]|uniref:Uncharacterized protein n=1 Tax=Hibiscus sabdariffa TaxID=183260 RepID=A0ABR2R2D9_9ROSI
MIGEDGQSSAARSTKVASYRAYAKNTHGRSIHSSFLMVQFLSNPILVRLQECSETKIETYCLLIPSE